MMERMVSVNILAVVVAAVAAFLASGGWYAVFRQTDYESAAERYGHLRRWLKALVRPFTRLL
jgi:hypothetical protein